MRLLIIYLPQTEKTDPPAIALELIEGDAVFSIGNTDGQPVPEALQSKVRALVEELYQCLQSK